MDGSTKALYMMVTQDKYQLPLAVADSPTKLARIVGVHPDTVLSVISLTKRGKRKHPRYIKIEITEDEDE